MARILALVIDLAVLTVFATLILSNILFWVLRALPHRPPPNDDQVTLRAAISVTATLASMLFVYLWSFEAAGWSLGKHALHIRVVTTSSWRRPGPFHGLVRTLSKLVTIGTLGLGLLPMLFDAQRRTLHDRIAGTVVIER